MEDYIRMLLERYGETVTLQTAAGLRPARAFLQPLAQQGEAEPFSMTALGSVDDRLWRYLGQESLQSGDSVQWQGMNFSVRSSEPVYVQGRLTHWWAMLERARKAAE